MSDSLMPRSDSFNVRVRGASHIDFKTSTTGVAAKAMRNELSALVNTVKELETRKVRVCHSIFSHLSPNVEIASHSRLSTLRCSRSSTSSPVIFQTALVAKNCALLSHE